MRIRVTSAFSLDSETVAQEDDVLEVQDRLGIELISANKAVKVEPDPAPAADESAPADTSSKEPPAPPAEQDEQSGLFKSAEEAPK